jgi:sucrose-6-phosphate hydrolase SacC (GH32 family)
MALYVRENEVDGIRFLVSPDLRHWTSQSWIGGYYECPDLFELPVEGRDGETRWVLLGADSDYQLGAFDGATFVPETEKLRGDWGPNYYASQTYSDISERMAVGFRSRGCEGVSIPECRLTSR